MHDSHAFISHPQLQELIANILYCMTDNPINSLLDSLGAKGCMAIPVEASAAGEELCQALEGEACQQVSCRLALHEGHVQQATQRRQPHLLLRLFALRHSSKGRVSAGLAGSHEAVHGWEETSQDGLQASEQAGC